MAVSIEKSETACPVCGETGFTTNYMGDEGARMKRTGECFTCAFWGNRADKGCATVIDGATYSPGNGRKGDRYNGMAGRRFDIEYFDGRRITTYDLWYGGVIPDTFRARLPDTARFLGEAERTLAGETTCFNPSDSRAPEYPRPDGKAHNP